MLLRAIGGDCLLHGRFVAALADTGYRMLILCGVECLAMGLDGLFDPAGVAIPEFDIGRICGRGGQCTGQTRGGKIN